MKNTNFPRLAILILITGLLLTGCFGWFEKDEMPADTTPATDEARPAASVPSKPIPTSPSFQDGDLYLQAIRSQDRNACALIQNEKLRERCEDRLRGS